MGGSVRIAGDILIYLTDGTVITCIDRKIFDLADDMATTVYYLTKTELEKMTQSNLKTIRFSLKCFDCFSSTEEGNFTASNKSSIIDYHSESVPVDVPELIKQLFDLN